MYVKERIMHAAQLQHARSAQQPTSCHALLLLQQNKQPCLPYDKLQA
jgi:hypothetical protein